MLTKYYYITFTTLLARQLVAHSQLRRTAHSVPHLTTHAAQHTPHRTRRTAHDRHPSADMTTFPYSELNVRSMLQRYETRMEELIADDVPEHLSNEACQCFVHFEFMYTECMPYYSRRFVGDTNESQTARVIANDMKLFENQLDSALEAIEDFRNE